MNDKIGICKRALRKGEPAITYNFMTGEVMSDYIKFLPYGKKKIKEKVLTYFGAKREVK